MGFLISATAVSASDTFKRIKDTINVIVEEYGVSRIRYGLVVYAREAVRRLSFGQESADIDSLKAAILYIQRPSGDPNLQGALEAAQNLFDSEPARPGVKRVLVVITDQKSTNTQTPGCLENSDPPKNLDPPKNSDPWVSRKPRPSIFFKYYN